MFCNCDCKTQRFKILDLEYALETLKRRLLELEMRENVLLAHLGLTVETIPSQTVVIKKPRTP